MRKIVVLCSLALMVFASTASAGLTNGDFDDPVSENGWTRWRAPWGANEVWSDPAGPSSGDLSLPGGNGSFGWYQRVAVAASEMVTISGEWTGDTGAAGWAEVMLFTSTEGLSDADVANRCDAGAAGDIAFKKDSWGLNPPNPWGWEPIGQSPFPDGNGGTIHATCNEVVVALKLGSVGGDNPWVSYDNLVIDVVPEPATALLLGLPLLLIRRRR